MVAGDRWAVDPDLAFVATADPNAVFRDVFDAEQSEGLDVDLLEDEVLAFGHFDRHQLVHLPSLLDQLRVLILTHLAGELLKVVIGQALHLILLYLRLVPLLQAVEVHQRAGTGTLARTAEELSFLFALFHHAILAFSLFHIVGDHDLLVVVDHVIHQH